MVNNNMIKCYDFYSALSVTFELNNISIFGARRTYIGLSI